jgi:hypothetical protein
MLKQKLQQNCFKTIATADPDDQAAGGADIQIEQRIKELEEIRLEEGLKTMK